MNLRKKLGLPEATKSDIPLIAMANIPIPLDVLIEVIVRQQSQLFGMLGTLTERAEATEGMIAEIMEQSEHLHGDVVELQQHLQAAAQHPVEKMDEEKAVKEILEKVKEKKETVH